MRQARDLATTFHTSLVRVRAFARWDYGLAASVLGISRRSIFFWKHLCLSEPAGSRLQWVSSSWPQPAQCGKNNNQFISVKLVLGNKFKKYFHVVDFIKKYHRLLSARHKIFFSDVDTVE